MNDSTSFTGSIPEFYDRYMGPVMFEDYARDLAQRVARCGGAPVLEAACGTGILTRALRAALPANTELIASEVAQAMLAYAQTTLGALPNTTWQLADLMALPFTPASFGAVACQFGVMFPPDKPAIFREVRRVLKPGGRFLFNVWDRLETNPFALTVHETLSALIPSNPPQFFTVPFAFCNHAELRALLQGSGFDDISITTLAKTATSPSAVNLATGMIQGSPVVSALQDRGLALDEVITEVAAALSALGGAAPFQSPMQAVVLSARAA
ncbi:MAG: class I SAM-dependent methyltransferase [Gammaproteobacteria bacterium]|nr:class I SAM-dependent methyltransferase [Gammaproteobacteria bacterium]